MSRGEVGDTLRYFEAGQMEAVMSRGNSRKLTRGQSSNSLKPGARGGKGLNPEALFSVAAMATVRILCLIFFSQSKCISRKLGLMPCLKTILNCFVFEHIASV